MSIYQAAIDQMSNNIVLIGYSGHAYSVIDAALTAGHEVNYYCEKKATIEDPFGLHYLGNEVELDFSGYKDHYFFPAVGNNAIRRKIVEFIENRKLEQMLVAHPSSSVSRHSSIGLSTIIGNGALINPVCTIGRGVIINTGAIVEHECRISDFAHIAPGAVLAGNVEIGEQTLVGANSVIKQGVTIGSNCIVGAGSVVLRDVPDNQTVVGNPSRVIKKNE